MRAAFIQSLVDLAQTEPRIMLLTGDLGFMVVEPFATRFPDRFINVGVAEQNLIGIATGLADSGYIPFAYSIVNFAVLRPYEFFRNGPILHQLPVRLVGIGGGIEYSNNGATHWGLEDIGVLRVQPGVQIIAPADSAQARSAIMATWNMPGPVYYRLGKNDAISIPGLDGRFQAEHLQVVREGSDVLLLAMGSIAAEAVIAAEALSARAIAACVGIVASMNPAPVADLVELLSRFALVVVVEAHYVNGGLGSLIAEIIAERHLRPRLVRRGVTAVPDGLSGSQHYMYEKNGISSGALFDTVVSELARQ